MLFQCVFITFITSKVKAFNNFLVGYYQSRLTKLVSTSEEGCSSALQNVCCILASSMANKNDVFFVTIRIRNVSVTSLSE